MDDRLKNILTLALRPDTSDAESEAALAAARRIVKSKGLDDLWKSTTQVVTRVETKVKVIYRDRHKPDSREIQMTVPCDYLHTIVEHMFASAQNLACEIVITSFQARNRNLTDSTLIEYRIHGRKDNLAAHYVKMEGLINQILHPNKSASTKNIKKVQGWDWFTNWFK
jgi:hypothetical protein